MGKLEENSKRKSKRGEIQKIILESIKLMGVLSVGLVAPNVLKAMHKLGLITNVRQSEIISSSASKLAKKGLLKFNGKYYELTKAGERQLRLLQLQNFKFNRPRKWDKKWRVIVFDIPEQRRKVRDRIRNLFITAGLVRLQDSVWVYPHDCEDIIGLLKTDFGIGKDLLYMIVDEIENDKHLREEFDLL